MTPSPAAAAEGLCDWLDALGRGAQARLEGEPRAAEYARAALAARPAGEAARRAKLALALSRDHGTSPEERASLLQEVLPSASPAVRGSVQAALGAALLEAGDAPGAVAALRAAIGEGSPSVASSARERLAAAYHAAGSPREAVAEWRRLSPGSLAERLDPRARLDFAADLRALGARVGATAILRSLWSALPEREEAEAAGELLERWRRAGDPIPEFSAEERLARAQRLAATGHPTAADRELAAAEACTPPPAAESLALARAALLHARGRTAEASAAVASLVDSPNPGVRRGAQLVLARAASRERRFADAIASWLAVAENPARIPGVPPAALSSLRDDAEFLAAWLHLDAGDAPRAAEALERLARRRPGSRRVEDARWFAAWALIRAGATSRAEAALRRLEGGPLAPRALYWRARLVEDAPARRRLLLETAAADPLGYYGVLATARLASEGAAAAGGSLSAGGSPPELDTLADAPLLRRAAELAAAGFVDEALAELASISRGRRGRRAAPAAAELAAFLGDPLVPFRIARDQLGLSRRTLAWSFPAAWPAIVEPASRASGIDPSLLRAVMRRESGFRAGVRSAAGAVGLLQIVPGTSARLVSLLRLPPELAGRLDEPTVNVPLGAAYLSLLLERFHEPLVAVAAYNAGPNAVLRWGQARVGLPLDAWIESIPYRETRDYVRAVVESWAGTRAAAGEPPPPIDPDRPVEAPAAGVAF